MLRNYFKIAFRNLGKHRTISIINIAGLTIGITAAVFIMLWVQNEFSFDNYLFADKKNRAYTFHKLI